MASLKGTRTEKNLLTAFCGETQARTLWNTLTIRCHQAAFSGTASPSETLPTAAPLR